MSDDVFRVVAHGRLIGEPMSETELEEFEQTVSVNVACGLAGPATFVVEKFDESDGWRVARTVDAWDAPPEFSNPNGGDDG